MEDDTRNHAWNEGVLELYLCVGDKEEESCHDESREYVGSEFETDVYERADDEVLGQLLVYCSHEDADTGIQNDDCREHDV